MKISNVLFLAAILMTLFERQEEEVDPVAQAYQRGLRDGSKLDSFPDPSRGVKTVLK